MNRYQAFKILDISASSSPAEIKYAFRKLAMLYHPDRGGDSDEFHKIKTAFAFLEMPQNNKIIQHDDNFIEIFHTISIYEAFHGSTLVFEFNNTKFDLQFPHVFYDDVLTVVQDDVTLKINFIISPDTKFDVNWDTGTFGDIKMQQSVCPLIMMMGGWAEVKTLDDSISKIRIPAGLSANSSLKIKGTGFWKNAEQYSRGDTYVKIIPDIQKVSQLNIDNLKLFLSLAETRINKEI